MGYKYIYPLDSVKTAFYERWIYFDSITKQRVVLVGIEFGSCEEDYNIELEPVLYYGLINKSFDKYKLHSSEIFGRFKITTRL